MKNVWKNESIIKFKYLKNKKKRLTLVILFNYGYKEML